MYFFKDFKLNSDHLKTLTFKWQEEQTIRKVKSQRKKTSSVVFTLEENRIAQKFWNENTPKSLYACCQGTDVER